MSNWDGSALLPWTRPRPEPDNISRPFWEKCAEGKLIIQRCTGCGHLQFYPRVMCTQCAGDPEWLEASGRGRVHTFTVIRQNRTPPMDKLVPYVVAIVELEESEDVRMMTNIVDCDPESIYIGMPVEFVTLPLPEFGIGMPFWKPAKA